MDQYESDVEVQFGIDSDPLPDAPWSNASGTLAVVIPIGTADGNHVITFKARNALGLTTTTMTLSVIVDSTPPTLTIVEPKRGTTTSSTNTVVTLKFSVMDTNRIEKIGYRVDGGEWLQLDPNARTAMVELDGFGEHAIDVRATDEAGNEVAASTTFEVEGEATHWLIISMLAVLLITVLGSWYVWSRRGRRGLEEDEED
jgi:hypothetical protein